MWRDSATGAETVSRGEFRDAILASGMADGAETNYGPLDELLTALD